MKTKGFTPLENKQSNTGAEQKKQNPLTGFTLVELNVAIVLFLIAVVSTLGILSFCTAAAKKSNEFAQCAHLAQSKMAEYLHFDADQITEVTTPAAFPLPFDKYKYTVTKLTPPGTALSGFAEIKVTVIGPSATQTAAGWIGPQTAVVALRNVSATGAGTGTGSGGAGLTPWYNLYASQGSETAYCISRTSDGGYIVAGSAQPGYANGKYYSTFRIMKLNSDGSIAWQKDIGDQSGNSTASSIQQTRDGGYVMSGTESGNKDSTKYTTQRIWIIKLNSDGSTSWHKAFLGSDMQSADVIQQTSDDGFVVTGYKQNSTGGEPYIMKLNPNGSIAWQKSYIYSGGANARTSAVQQTSDGGYLIAGKTQEYQGDGGITKALITKFNSDGSIAWQKAYSNQSAQINSARQTSDGGYIVSGEAMYNGYKKGALVVKLNPDGSIAWQKAFQGGTNEQVKANSVQQTADGGYIVAGENANTSSYYNQKGVSWMVKINPDGTVAWQNTYGQLSSDPAYAYKNDYSRIMSVQQAADGGYAVAGVKSVIDAKGYSNRDMMVFTVDSNGNNSNITVKSAAVTEVNPGLREYSPSRYTANSNFREVTP